jgi:hypothetical protein
MVLLVVSMMPKISIKDTPCLILMISVIGRFILIAMVIQMLLIAMGSVYELHVRATAVSLLQ